MATYKISYLDGISFSHKGEHCVDNVVDEYDAVEKMINQHGLDPENLKVLDVQLICE